MKTCDLEKCHNDAQTGDSRMEILSSEVGKCNVVKVSPEARIEVAVTRGSKKALATPVLEITTR